MHGPIGGVRRRAGLARRRRSALLWRETSATFFLAQAFRNDTLALLDADGALVEAYRYGLHGEVEVLQPVAGAWNVDRVGRCSSDTGACASTYGNTLLWSGAHWRAGVGLYDLRARQYDPRQGVFLSPDPLGYVDSFYEWLYAGGDPFNAWDPFGLERVGTGEGGSYWGSYGARNEFNVADAQASAAEIRRRAPPSSSGRYRALQQAQEQLAQVVVYTVAIEVAAETGLVAGVARGAGNLAMRLPVVATAANAVSARVAGAGATFAARYPGIALRLPGSWGAEGVVAAGGGVPLARVLEGHGAGQGFTGVFDAATGRGALRPSTAEAVIPEGWVARQGGTWSRECRDRG